MGIRTELLESHGETSVSPVRSIDGDECQNCRSSLYEHGKFISTELRTR